jgi:glycosyltransferase involved in cell wall biosynthesis
MSKFKVLFISPYYPTKENPHHAPFIKRVVDELKIDSEVDLDFYHFKAQRKFKNYIAGRQAVKELLQKSEYDIIHINWGQSIVILPFRFREKLIVTFRGGDVLGIINQYGKKSWVSFPIRLLSNYAAYKATKCICVSQEIKSKLNQKHKSTIIPSGVKTHLFSKISKTEARRKLGLGLDKIIVLFVGNPKNSRKRYMLAEKIITKLTQTYEKLELITVWKKKPLEVYEYMYAADYILQVSLQEGSPNIIKEAIMCNLPVISSPVGDTLERVGHLKGCYISESFSYTSLLKITEEAVSLHNINQIYDYSDEIKYFTMANEVKKVKEVYSRSIL